MNRNTLFICPHLCNGFHLAKQLRQIKIFFSQFYLFIFQFTQFQRVIDQRQQMVCRYSCLKTAGIHQCSVLRVLHADIHKSDNSIQWCTHIMGHPGKKIRFTLVCFFLALQGNGFFHQFIFIQNQIPVFDYSIRFANFVSPVLNIFPGSIFASHSICDFIMIRFTILLQRMCNPLLQIIRMCQVSNRPSRSFYQFLWGIISQHLCKML